MEPPHENGRVPEAVNPPPGNPRFSLLDGMRAIAALSIVATHTAGLSRFNEDNPLGHLTARLNVGVAIFFVLSGFLLYRPFVAARYEGRPAPSIRRYVRRRLLRILPAYWFALTVLAIWPGLSGVFTDHWWVYYLFLQNLHGYWVMGGITPAWSLCVEMAFYVLLPFLVIAMRGWLAGRSRTAQLRGDLLGLGVLAALSFAVRTWVHHSDPASIFGNTLPAMFTWFALGMGMAVVSAAGWQPRPVRFVESHAGATWAIAIVLYAFVSYALGFPRGLPYAYSGAQFAEEHLLFGLFSLLLVAPMVFGSHNGGWPRRLLGSRLVAWLGLVSYGIFLWHVPIALKLVQSTDILGWFPQMAYATFTIVTAVLATACAAVSYYAVERPLLRFKDARRPSAPAPPGPGRPTAGRRGEGEPAPLASAAD